MPDLFDPLRDLGEHMPSAPLPSAEVRRLGDRMRRRRQALQVLGGAAAVAVVATGSTYVVTSLSDPVGHTPMADAPAAGWVTEIPASYALDRGYPTAHDLPGASQLGPSQKYAPFSEPGLTACGATVYPSLHPADSYGTTFTQPDLARDRELTVYDNAAQATEVTTRLTTGLRGCEAEQVTPLGTGDASWRVTASSPGNSTINIARVGNAVLLDRVTVTHPVDDNVESAFAGQEAQFGPLVADMCIFALDPCAQAPHDGLVPPKIPLLDHGALLSTEQLEQLYPQGWEQIRNREDPTLDCQTDWLHGLGPRLGAFREWRTPTAEAASAVIEFDDTASALTAYETVQGWIASCDHRLPGVRSLTPYADPVDGQTDVGQTYSRTFTAPADKQHAMWQDHQGVALAGKRVVMLSVAHLSQDLASDDTPWDALLESAADRAAAPDLLTHVGLGALRLGMSAAQAQNAGVAVVHAGTPCSTFQLTAYPPRPDKVDGYLTTVNGVESIFARPGVTTAEGIGLGSTRAEVEAAYAHLVGSNGYLEAPAGDTARYRFGFDKGKVVELDLALFNQSCFG